MRLQATNVLQSMKKFKKTKVLRISENMKPTMDDIKENFKTIENQLNNK